MRRREFITLLGGAAAAWPINVRAQQKIPRVGVLVGGSNPPARDFELVHQLTQLGYTEGHNITYEIRGAEGDSNRLPQLAQELVATNQDVIRRLHVSGGSCFGSRDADHPDRDDGCRRSNYARAEQQHITPQP